MCPAGFFSDAIGPCMTTCPRFITMTASQTDSTSGMTCDDRMRLIFLLCAMSRTSASISSRPLRIHAVGRLVEQQQIGIVHERLRELDALLHAGRIGFDVAVARLAEADVVEHLVRALHGVGRRQPGELAAIGDERDGRHAGNLRVVLRHVADARADFERRLGHVEIEHADAAGVRLDEAEQRLEHRALPGAVRAEQADRPGRKRGRHVRQRPLTCRSARRHARERRRFGH